jgi:hypothetical protein
MINTKEIRAGVGDGVGDGGACSYGMEKRGEKGWGAEGVSTQSAGRTRQIGEKANNSIEKLARTVILGSAVKAMINTKGIRELGTWSERRLSKKEWNAGWLQLGKKMQTMVWKMVVLVERDLLAG